MVILPGLAGVIDSFQIPGGLVALRRTAQGPDKNGEEQPPLEVPFDLDPVVAHPEVGRNRTQSSRGDSDAEIIIIFSEVKLQTAKGGTSILADVVLYDPAQDGQEGRYVVHSSEPWVQQAGHWRSKASLEEEP